MMTTLSWLLVLCCLGGCSSGLGSVVGQLGRDGKVEIGRRFEVKLEYDDPMQSEKEPCPHRRKIYDQGDKSSSFFDQCLSVSGALKF